MDVRVILLPSRINEQGKFKYDRLCSCYQKWKWTLGNIKIYFLLLDLTDAINFNFDKFGFKLNSQKYNFKVSTPNLQFSSAKNPLAVISLVPLIHSPSIQMR